MHWKGHGTQPKNASTLLVTQSCPALCDPMDCSAPGSSVHGIRQTRILEWVAIPFSTAREHLNSNLNFTTCYVSLGKSLKFFLNLNFLACEVGVVIFPALLTFQRGCKEQIRWGMWQQLIASNWVSLFFLKFFHFVLEYSWLTMICWLQMYSKVIQLWPLCEYWSGLSCPSPGNLPDPGIKPVSLPSPALADWFFTTSAAWEAQLWPYKYPC